MNHTMGYLQDYLTYNKGNECPEAYHVWSALSVLSSVVSRKVWLDLGYFHVLCNLYTCLVGEQGGRKTVAKDIAYDLLKEVEPTLPCSGESMTKEAITRFMASEECTRFFTMPDGAPVEYHPFTIFITELKNFLSINIAGMLDFLTTIYDRKFYDVITKHQGTDVLVNPYVVLLACETPDWIVSRLRESIISVGFSRRMVWVYSNVDKRIAFPVVTPEASAAWLRVKDCLRRASQLVGEFRMDDATRSFYQLWYESQKLPDDPLIRGYVRVKHILALKTAMLIAIGEQQELLLRKEYLELAIALLESNEKDLPRLTQGAGRNVLAHPAVRLLETVEKAGGFISEKDLRRVMFAQLDNAEFYSVLQHLTTTEQLRVIEDKRGPVVRRCIATPEYIEALKKGSSEQHR